jgi:hypothetical protein
MDRSSFRQLSIVIVTFAWAKTGSALTTNSMASAKMNPRFIPTSCVDSTFDLKCTLQR